eukprot:TRINITY_DN64769_c0_g1_i1.p1 TRINITY_DN64769_c0_g1~~TRINITY_DN64769_c0_g1_i1.p1  ORF type:complete len:499 (-),score=141.06 TRINITY_DN64769_c0_g1_i1:140-1636(-)
MASPDVGHFNGILSRLEAVADRLEQAASGGGGYPAAAGGATASAAADPPIVVAFDAFLQAHLPALEAAASETGAKDVEEGTAHFAQATKIIRDLLLGSTRCKKPADSDWAKFFGPASELCGAASKACDNRSDFFQNRKASTEALGLMQFIIAPSPPAHAQNTLESMDFHAMKVMQKKNDKETAWIKLLKAFVKDFQDFCNENCKLGVTWNAGGEDAATYFAANPLGSGGGAAAGGKSAGKGKKGPGGPPPPAAGKGGGVKAPPKAVPQAASGGGMSEVFGAISGFDTGKLKKVTDDMKTKNRSKDDAAPAAPAPKAKAAAAPAAGGRSRDMKGPRGPPRMEIEKDTNMIIENQEGVSDLKIDDLTMSHLVCIINCKNCTIQVTSKVKSINVDGCERVNVVCNDVLSTIELVNSDRCKVQILGVANSVAIDKCNGVNIFLSKASIACEIVTSKSSEMNLTIPEEGGGEMDVVELPIPEQFVTTVAGAKSLKTVVSGIYS